MSNTFTAGTLLIHKESGESFLVERTFTITRGSEFKTLRAVSNFQPRVIKLDVSTVELEFLICVPDA